MQKSIFFAYESGHHENKDAIRRGIKEFNDHQKTYKARSWEDLRISGKVLNNSILSAIDECDVFCCDLTYRNYNVLFELGYAIGKKRQLLIFLNPSIKGAKETYSASRILKNIGYETFQNGNEVLKILQQKGNRNEISVDQLINIDDAEINSYDLLYLSSIINNQASLDLGSYISGLTSRVIQNNTSEVEYQTLTWYLTSITKCRNILIHLLGKDNTLEDAHNAEYSLFAGLGCGMGKHVMLIAPEPFVAPIDYDDILIQYSDATECLQKTKSWLERNLSNNGSPEIVSGEIEDEEHEYNLLKLGIGYETAEEEEENLLDYFIEIDTYRKALNRASSIITGRKGAGKSALFIRLKSYFTKECSNCFNIFIKPESNELISNVELSRIYANERTKKDLLLTVWRFVFITHIFHCIYEKVSNQLPETMNEKSIEKRVLQLYEEYCHVMQTGPFSAMSLLYNEWSTSEDDKPDVLDRIYKRLLSKLIEIVQLYMAEHKYIEINILADNLDKTWDSNSDLKLQSEMILSLLEYNGIISKDLHNPNIRSHTILILRTDIYEYILNYAREPDKIEIRRVDIDWSRYPIKLKELLEARFLFILDNDEDNAEEVWKEYFDLDRKKHPFQIISELVVARPRDTIYFVSKLFESAVNNNHQKVNNDDLYYAIEAYSNFLHKNLIAETKAQFPEIVNIVSELQNYYVKGWMDYKGFESIIVKNVLTRTKKEQLINFLLSKNYLVATVDGQGRKIETYSEIERLIKERRMLFLKKNKIQVQFHPQRQRLKSPRV